MSGNGMISLSFELKDNLTRALKACVEGKEDALRLAASALEALEDMDTPIGRLTEREMEVFRLVGQALDSKEIGERLGIRAKTVDIHKYNMRAKLGLVTGRYLLMAAVRYVDSKKAKGGAAS